MYERRSLVTVITDVYHSPFTMAAETFASSPFAFRRSPFTIAGYSR